MSLLLCPSFLESQSYLGTKHGLSAEMISDLKLWGKEKIGRGRQGWGIGRGGLPSKRNGRYEVQTSVE